MDRLVLVTFATRYGSTAETAQAVARTQRDGGVAVDLLPIREVASLDRYCAVVLGAALYVGRLHNEARQFEKVPVSDARDWTMIRRWATDLAPLLRW